MKTLIIFLTALTLVAMFSANATSRIYSSIEKFIDESDIVAIVEVGPRDPNVGYPNPDKTSQYRQLTKTTVNRVFKGEILKQIAVVHGKELDDVLFQQGQGLYLVFLKQASEGWIPYDGWPSSKHIKDNLVLGWAKHPYYWADTGTPLEEAITQVMSQLNNANKEANEAVDSTASRVILPAGGASPPKTQEARREKP